ncbi:MAG: hypothetical protein ISP86_02365, partial [Shewanellaceae bacterium]|nr:hypothetical protein [Shewanellaceae bacterium]
FKRSFATLHKTSNYGSSMAVAKDGSVVVVGAATDNLYCFENSIEGDPTKCYPEESESESSIVIHGTAYVYHPATKKTWIIKPKQDATYSAEFGTSVAVSGDGLLLAVGAIGDQRAGANDACNGIVAAAAKSTKCTMNLSNQVMGAVHIYAYHNSAWKLIYYVHTDNANTPNMNNYKFGTKLMWSEDGTTLVVGMPSDKNTPTIGSYNQPTTIGTESTAPGAVYVYKYDSADGSLTFDYYYQQVGATALGKSMHAISDGVVVNADNYVLMVKLKGSNSHGVTQLTSLPTLPAGVSISEASLQGNQLAIGLPKLSSDCKKITVFNADKSAEDCLNNNDPIKESGGVMVFEVDSNNNEVTAKALVRYETSIASAHMGRSLSVSTDQKTMFVGVSDHNACVNIHGSRQDCGQANSNLNYGAIGHFTFDGSTWAEQSYIKASKNVPNAHMGASGSMHQTDTDLFFLLQHSSSCQGIQDGACQEEQGYRGVVLQYQYNDNADSS